MTSDPAVGGAELSYGSSVDDIELAGDVDEVLAFLPELNAETLKLLPTDNAR